MSRQYLSMSEDEKKKILEKHKEATKSVSDKKKEMEKGLQQTPKIKKTS